MKSLRKEESAAASILLYSVLTSLFFLAVQARSHKPGCASSCGDIENISYPFRLKVDPVGCGDPDYELSCVNNKTILEIFPGKYYVKNISYDEHIIRLVDVNFADRSSCSLPSGSVVSRDGYVNDFRFLALGTNQTYTQFVKCSRNISQANVAAYNYTAVPCLTRVNGTNYFYAVYDGYYLARPRQPPCSLISVAISDYHENFVEPLSYEAIMKQLEAGFDLGWSVECRDCSLAGKSCGVDVSDLNLGTKPLPYQCYEGTEYKEPTELQIILIFVGIALGALFAVVLLVVLLVFRIRRCMRRHQRKKNQQQSSTPALISSS
ncbi:uncharacterized protein LOC112200603 [Rosa chinensis]|uniref:uncharacterized protein LOC112200603 n=1 Tax=Rosa chinensis TaxID=74649 RepID=UPI000D08D3ED|nr:uncharacterized protein LOC112200603 [Rosa chinensis]